VKLTSHLHLVPRLGKNVARFCCFICLNARLGERRGAYRALVGKPEGRRRLGRPRRRWEDNIKMDL
jgi:hypothetical protein